MTIPALPVSARAFIPQQPPIVMIDNILVCEEERFVTNFLIRFDNVFVENGRMRESGLMENIAQTCAARVGFCAADQKVPRGVIGGISRFELQQLPNVGETLTTIIRVVAGVASALVVDAEVYVGKKAIAACSMKVFITED